MIVGITKTFLKDTVIWDKEKQELIAFQENDYICIGENV
jgi:hypothetical protein